MANSGSSDLAGWVDERLAVLALPIAETGLDGQVDPRSRAWLRLEAAQRAVRLRRQAGLTTAGAVLLGGSLWHSADGVLADLKAERHRAVAPDFALRDQAGNTVRLSQFQGKVVLVDFWATWCPPCRQEIPWFAAFQRTYAPRGFTVLGVAMDEDGWKSVAPFVESVQADYPMVAGTNEVARQFGVETLPVTVVIDRSGRIAATHVGLVSRRAVESEIRYLLGSR